MLLRFMVLSSMLVSTVAHAQFGKKDAIANITDGMAAKMVKSIRNAGGTNANAKNIHMQVTYGGQKYDENEECKISYDYNYNIIWRYDEKSRKETLDTKETIIFSATASDSNNQRSYEPIVPGLPRFNLKYMDYNSADHSFTDHTTSNQRRSDLGDFIRSIIGVPFDRGYEANYTTTIFFDENNLVSTYEIVDHRDADRAYICVIDNSRPIFAEGRIINNDNSYGGGFSLNSETGKFEQWKAADSTPRTNQ